MKNKFVVKGEVTEISVLNGGQEDKVLIDTEDLEKVMISDNTWFVVRSPSGNAYAGYRKTKKKKSVEGGLMHRVLTDAGRGTIVDHINNNGLDNRKINLRFVSKKENGQNRTKAQSNSKSGVLGVNWNKHHGKWEAGIRIDGKRINLGYFSSLDEAKEMVSLARAKYMTHAPESKDQNKDFSKLMKTGMEPQGNNKSNCRYVNWSKRNQKWVVQMWVGKEKHYFGYYENLEDAKKVAIEMKQKYKP